jgi:hypothetical protein
LVIILLFSAIEPESSAIRLEVILTALLWSSYMEV